MDLRNCPDEYFDNCKNAYLRCRVCAAGGGEPQHKLWYRPVTGRKEDHPVYREQKQTTQQARQAERQRKKPQAKKTKASHRKEQETKQRLIKQTRRSGAEFGDGDYQLLEGEFQADHKWRSKTQAFSLSYKEYQQGRAQGTNTWVITNCYDERMVLLTEEAYAKLLELARKGRDVKDV